MVHMQLKKKLDTNKTIDIIMKLESLAKQKERKGGGKSHTGMGVFLNLINVVLKTVMNDDDETRMVIQF